MYLGNMNKFNDYWIRPVDEYRPKNADRVENACYWLLLNLSNIFEN